MLYLVIGAYSLLQHITWFHLFILIVHFVNILTNQRSGVPFSAHVFMVRKERRKSLTMALSQEKLVVPVINPWSRQMARRTVYCHGRMLFASVSSILLRF